MALRLSGLQRHNRRPDKAFTPPSGNTYARWSCAYQACNDTTVGRIRRLRRHPATRKPDGAALIRPTTTQP
ncbi:hypothetical protein EGS84_16445 [Citrobacter koseri]|uniref:Uncharacterized protein n=1 Tax=Citrobacter koseri TaxID=545 RepID=A0AAQ0V8J5_CITKO|nr:hypothetical protein EGS84_16445 [Citrobacter koseri]